MRFHAIKHPLGGYVKVGDFHDLGDCGIYDGILVSDSPDALRAVADEYLDEGDVGEIVEIEITEVAKSQESPQERSIYDHRE